MNHWLICSRNWALTGHQSKITFRKAVLFQGSSQCHSWKLVGTKPHSRMVTLVTTVLAGPLQRAVRIFRDNRDKAQLPGIHNTWTKNQAWSKIHIRELAWWKPRKARLPISRVCYLMRKHLHAARAALPCWALPNARDSCLCWPHTTPQCCIWNHSGLQANTVLGFSSSAAPDPPSPGRCLGRGASPSLTSPPSPSQPQEAHVLCRPWGNITRIA